MPRTEGRGAAAGEPLKNSLVQQVYGRGQVGRVVNLYGPSEDTTYTTACAHPRDAGCGCRKPAPGLILGLAETHRVDLARSVMVGDTAVDRLLAANAGIGRFTWAVDYFRTDAAGGAP